MNEKEEIAKIVAGAGDFGECLVEGNAEDKRRARKIRRRAILVSIALQSAGLTALAIAPMLAKPAEIRITSTMPVPPYRNYTQQRQVGERRLIRQVVRPTIIFPPTQIPPRIATVDRFTPPPDPGGTVELPPGVSGLPASDGLVPLVDSRSHTVVPPPPPETKRVVIGHIDPALLSHRVEPLYPALARQIRKSGKVELHAVIGMDGTIQSLEVVSGDPLFVQSALDAVKQWRYTPTKLNGHAVEVDTFITVIYTLNSQ
jgi:periplasmic protein TonB